MEGQIVKLRPDGNLIVQLRNKQEVPCRRPSTVDRGWLRACLAIGPVDAEGTLDVERGAGSVWCVFPGPEHERAAPPVLSLVATERVSLVCGKTSLSMEKDGSFQVRGRDILTRGSRSARLSGAIVRIN
jgi:hypothetical protein